MPFAQSALHAAQPLVDLCVAYKPEEEGFLRSAFFPRKPVSHLTDNIRQISKGDILRLYDLDTSGDATAVNEVQYRIAANLTYNCNILAAKARISPIDVKNADAALQHEMRQTKQALISIGQRMEYLAVNQTLRSASVITNNETLAAAERWDNFGSTSSQPIEDLQGAIDLIRARIGKSGRSGRIKIAMHQFVWRTITQHPNVLDRVIHNPPNGGLLTKAIFADMLEVGAEDVVITSNNYTSSDQGDTDAYKAFIGSDVILAYCDDGGLDDQAMGHEFVFDGLAGEDPYLVRKWREEGVGALGMDFVGVACACDYKVTNTDAAFLFKAVVDTTDSERYGTFLD